MSSPWTVQYHQRVLATDPFAYWLLDEKSGTVAYDLVSGRVAGAQNGAHVGVALGQDGIGDGRTSPLYDGANDYINILTAAFAAAFNGAAGSVMCWGRVAGAGTWTDGADRIIVRILVNGANYTSFYKSSVNNQVRYTMQSGGAGGTRIAAFSSTDWFVAALTWTSGASYQAYLNGIAQGAAIAIGVWAGAPTLALLGAISAVPAAVWDGTLAHCAVWGRALSADEVAELYKTRWA